MKYSQLFRFTSNKFIYLSKISSIVYLRWIYLYSMRIIIYLTIIMSVAISVYADDTKRVSSSLVTNLNQLVFKPPKSDSIMQTFVHIMHSIISIPSSSSSTLSSNTSTTADNNLFSYIYSITPLFFDISFKLGAVVFLVFVVVNKYIIKFLRIDKSPSLLQKVDTLALTPQNFVHIVRIDCKYYVIGTSHHSTLLIAKICAENIEKISISIDKEETPMRPPNEV